MSGKFFFCLAAKQCLKALKVIHSNAINDEEIVDKINKKMGQDTFDHHKGQESAISGRRLHWIFLNFLQWIIFLFLLCRLVRKSPKMWTKLPDFPAEKKAWNPVTSLAVMEWAYMSYLSGAV